MTMQRTLLSTSSLLAAVPDGTRVRTHIWKQRYGVIKEG